jgi:hypothetical protein
MLKRAGKWPKLGDLAAHLRKVCEIAFTHVLSCVLLCIGQDLLGLMHKPIGVLQRRPQRPCGL